MSLILEGHRKGNRGRGGDPEKWVFWHFQAAITRFLRATVIDVTRKSLRQIIKQQAAQGKRFIADYFKDYDGLITDGYKHYRVNLLKNLQKEIGTIFRRH